MQMSRSHYSDRRHASGFHAEHPNIGRYVPAPTSKATAAAAGMAELAAVCRKITDSAPTPPSTPPPTSSGHPLAAQLAAALIRIGEGTRRLEQQVAALERAQPLAPVVSQDPRRAELAAALERVEAEHSRLAKRTADGRRMGSMGIPAELDRMQALAIQADTIERQIRVFDQEAEERAEALRIPEPARRKMAAALSRYNGGEVCFRASADWSTVEILGIGNCESVLSRAAAFHAGDHEIHSHGGSLAPSTADLNAAELLQRCGVSAMIVSYDCTRARPITFAEPRKL